MYNRILQDLYKENGKTFLFIIVLMILVGFLQATAVVGIMPLVDLILNEDLNEASPVTLYISEVITSFNLPVTLGTLGLFYLLMVLSKSLILLYQEYVTANFLMNNMSNLIHKEYNSFIEASWTFFGSKQYGTLSNTVVGETQKAIIAYECLAVLAASSIGLLFYIALALIISWKLTLLSLFCVIVIFTPLSLLDRYVYKIRKRHTEAYNNLQSLVYDTLNAIKLIIGFSKREASKKKLRPITEVVIETGVKYTIVRVFISLITEPLTIIVVLASVIVGINYIGLSLGTLFGFLYAVNRIVWQGQLIVAKKNEFFASLPSFDQIYSLKEESDKAKESTGTRSIESLNESIQIKDLTFSYNNSEAILSNISVFINKGDMIAIVGPSGSGKSTLIDLIMGFQNAHKGSILIDNQDLKTIDLHSWREVIGYIPQQPFLFNASLKDNLIWAKENASNEEIKKACDLANATEFISQLDGGFDTILGERGVKISGGQAQRLCLARALLKDPKILILDEATSSLDSHSEKMIQSSIEYLSGNTTIISVAHRLSTIRQANNIYYLEGGRVKESGSFEELMSLEKGFFKTASKLQGL